MGRWEVGWEVGDMWVKRIRGKEEWMGEGEREYGDVICSSGKKWWGGGVLMKEKEI